MSPKPWFLNVFFWEKKSVRKDLRVWKLSGFSAPRCGGQRSPWAAPGERCQRWEIMTLQDMVGVVFFFFSKKMKPNYFGEWESCMEDGNIFLVILMFSKNETCIYHLENRWRNVPCIWFIIAPYIVDTFGEWLAIYFHHGVTYPTKGEKENHLQKYLGMGYVIVPWRVSNPTQFVRFFTSHFFHSSIITTFV